MRKPNVSEATNEFIGLAIQCEHSEQPSFAGQTYVDAAKCEALAGNHLGEAEQYLAAARQFVKAEQKLLALKFFSPDRENLEVNFFLLKIIFFNCIVHFCDRITAIFNVAALTVLSSKRTPKS